MSVTMFGSEGLQWYRSHKISNLRDEVGLSGLTMPCEKNLEIVICTLNMSTSMFGGEGLYICVKGSPEHQNSSKVSLGWSVLNFRMFDQFCNFSLFHQKWAIFLFSDKKLKNPKKKGDLSIPDTARNFFVISTLLEGASKSGVFREITSPGLCSL